MDNKRVDYLDMLKGLGMFIVVSGHIHPKYGWFSLPIHAFVIPMYFMLSGMTFKRSKFPNLRQLIKRRIKTLLIPYFMFSIITWMFWAVYNSFLHNDIDYWGPLLQTFIAQGSGEFLVHNVPLWFITCLFVVEIIYYYVDKLPEWANIFTCFLFALIGVYMIRGGHLHFFRLLPWNIECAMSAIGFYAIGNILMKHFTFKEIEQKVLLHKESSISVIIILTFILVFSAYDNGHISIGSNIFGRSTTSLYLNAFVGIISIFLFSIIFCSLKGKNSIITKVIDYCLWFGKNSYYILATHVPIKGIIMVGISLIIKNNVDYVSKDILLCIVTFILTCIICSILSILIAKQKQRDEQWFMKTFKHK